MFEEGVGARGIMQLSLFTSLAVDFSIQVLSSGSWPFQQSCTFALPSEVRRLHLVHPNAEWSCKKSVLRGWCLLLFCCVSERTGSVSGVCLFGWRIFGTRWVSKVVGGNCVKYVTVFSCGRTLVNESFFKTFNSNWSKYLLLCFSVYTFL